MCVKGGKREREREKGRKRETLKICKTFIRKIKKGKKHKFFL